MKKRLKSIMTMEMKDHPASCDVDDENLEHFITISKTLEEIEILKQKQDNAYRKLDKTIENLRLYGGKEESNKKIVELEKMLNISSDENVALKLKMNQMEKYMEEKVAELKDLKSINQTIMVRERKYNDEIQEARGELIYSMQGLPGCVNIGIKRLGELDLAPFEAAVKKRICPSPGLQKTGLEPQSDVEDGRLCFLWKKHLGDPGWHPFKMVRVGDKFQEIINDDDPKLKGLKSELGEDAYKAVTTSLMEMSRYPVSEIWNFVEGRKASLKEGYGFVFEKLKNVGKSSMVSSPSINPSSSAPGPNIAATNPSSSMPGPNIAATNPSSSALLNLDPCEIPNAKFHDFMADKSYGVFWSGQIWALYCDLDDLPKYYVQITQVRLNPGFELHVRHLDSSHSPRCKLQWADKSMPICYGTFKVGAEAVVYKDAKFFSHQLCAKLVSESNYEIYPRRGEVWAIYKDFDSKWTCSYLKNCKYDIVEVLKTRGGSKITVLVLEQVTGFKTVFKPKKNSAGDDIVREIAQAVFLTFSHQIPAFRLTVENEGSLQGYWELDPNSIPVYLFSSN